MSEIQSDRRGYPRVVHHHDGRSGPVGGRDGGNGTGPAPADRHPDPAHRLALVISAVFGAPYSNALALARTILDGGADPHPGTAAYTGTGGADLYPETPGAVTDPPPYASLDPVTYSSADTNSPATDADAMRWESGQS